MTRRPLQNISASVRQRLLTHAKEHGSNYDRVLARYAIERLLFRLSQTEARDDYFLKGAMLFATWPAHAFRPTGDLDLLGHGNADPAAIIELFTHICQVEVPEDGIIFDTTTLRHETIREDETYQGISLSLSGRLGTAIVPVQVDIGFGDSVYPAPQWATFPVLLPELPPAKLLMYPPETVVAEKFEALVRFGERNSRLKDFYDIWVATRTFPFDLATLVEAIGGTLRRRETLAPTSLPVALTPRFAEMPDTQGLWSGFLRRTPPTLPPPPLADLLAELRRFFAPVLPALAVPETAKGRWNPDRTTWEQADF